MLKKPQQVYISDITIRDGFQHEEIYVSLDAKVTYAEHLILAGVKRLEVTNFGNPKNMPQFKDGHELLKRIRTSPILKKAGVNWDEIDLTVITIREHAVDLAIKAKEEGYGPDRIVMMVSTDEEHHYANSGTTLPEYWKEAERCIKKAHDAGIKMNGTVSTIWGSPISGPTKMEDAVLFTKRWLEIGAHDVEHADHDGSSTPDQVYKYYSMILNAIPDPMKHIAHFHTTRGWGLANIYSALQAGIICFESTIGGIGGQPANFLDDCPVPGTGDYYYRNPNSVGLVCTEDLVLMMEEMGIHTGIDVNEILKIGLQMEKTLRRRLRSESILSGPIPKSANVSYKRKGLVERKQALGEQSGQRF